MADTKRDVTVTSELGPDVLLCARMTGTEEMSRPFEYVVDLLTQEEDIELHKLVGQPMTVHLTIAEGKTRHFNGLIAKVAYTGSDGDYNTYSAVVRPWVWTLSRRTDCRVFQDMKVPDIVKEVFRDAGFSDFEEKLSGTYVERGYCVQYRESDLDFVNRLLEEDGIYYYFVHEDGKHTLVLADSINAHAPFDGHADMKFFPPGRTEVLEEPHIFAWEVAQEYQSNIFAQTDYDFVEPTKDLATNASIPRDHTRAEFEVYDYPGGYTDAADGDTLAKIRIEEIQAGYERCAGTGNVPGVAVGHLFTLGNHPRGDLNQEYLVLSCRHALTVGSYESKSVGGGEASYECAFTVQPSAQAYRPQRVTPKPGVRGPQTATIVGPDGETVWCDEYGRVKVQFHWDRVGEMNENSSCWVRVSQPSAGARWGSMFLPHVGHEVIVDFLEGDPDKPIITGRVYNADNMPPRPLPDEKYRSVIRDHFGNEIVFDGTSGEEHMMLRSPSHNSTYYLGKSSVQITDSDGYEWTMGSKHTRYMGDFSTTKVGDSWSSQHGRSFDQFFGIKTSLAIAAKQSVDVGTSASFAGGFSVSGSVGIKASFHLGKDVALGSQSYTKSVDKNITMDSNKTFKAVGGPKDQSILRLAPDEATLTYGQGGDAAGSNSAKVAFLAGLLASAGAIGGNLYGSDQAKNAAQKNTIANMKTETKGTATDKESTAFQQALRDSEGEWNDEWIAGAAPLVVMLVAAATEMVRKGRAENDAADEANGVKAMIQLDKTGVTIAAGNNLESAEPFNGIYIPPTGKIYLSAKEEIEFKAGKVIEIYADKKKKVKVDKGGAEVSGDLKNENFEAKGNG